MDVTSKLWNVAQKLDDLLSSCTVFVGHPDRLKDFLRSLTHFLKQVEILTLSLIATCSDMFVKVCLLTYFGMLHAKNDVAIP